MLFCRPSGSGKTIAMMHMIYNLLYFDTIYLYAKNLDLSLKTILQKNYKKKQQRTHIASYILTSHGNLQQRTSMKNYKINQLYIMIYSNGLLPSTATTNQRDYQALDLNWMIKAIMIWTVRN